MAAPNAPQSPSASSAQQQPLSPEQKLAVARQLRQTAWELVRAGVRMREPGLSDDAVEERVRRIFLLATS
jgi:hypothetical protein